MPIPEDLHGPIQLLLSEGLPPDVVGAEFGVPASEVLELNRQKFHIDLRQEFSYYLDRAGLPCRIGAESQQLSQIFAGIMTGSAELVVNGAENGWPVPEYPLALRLYARARIIPMLRNSLVPTFRLHKVPMGLTRDREHLLPRNAAAPLFEPFRWPTQAEIDESTAAMESSTDAEEQAHMQFMATERRFVIDFPRIEDLGEFFLPLLEMVPASVRGMVVGLRHKPEYEDWKDAVLKTYIETLGGEVSATEIVDQPVR